MTNVEMQSRFDYPLDTKKHKAVMHKILELLKDGRRRSKKEIREALNLPADIEIGARLRDLRKPENGAWPVSDARAEGPDPDGIYRYQLRSVNR